MPKSNAERQARYQAKIRAMTPLQRLMRVPEGSLYTLEERKLLEDFRKAEETLRHAADRLNDLVRMRLTATLADLPADDLEGRKSLLLALSELDRQGAVRHAAF